MALVFRRAPAVTTAGPTTPWRITRRLSVRTSNAVPSKGEAPGRHNFEERRSLMKKIEVFGTGCLLGCSSCKIPIEGVRGGRLLNWELKRGWSGSMISARRRCVG